jgi:hypothetical protein
MKKLVFLVSVLILLAASYSEAQEMNNKMNEHPDHILKVPQELKWIDGPASLPKGAKVTVLEGDLSQPGPFTFRAKLPANYKILPHFHPNIEHITVLSGAFHMGLGDIFDESKATELPAGGFGVMEKGIHHFAFTKGETEIQVHSIGPWGITYVNPSDDPRNQQATK